MPISVKFKFDKAGQGSFYTGNFRQHTSDSRFSVVYDCGTNSANKEFLRRAIWKFQGKLMKDHNSTLDLLIISHFDSDHVNEVEALLQQLKFCDTIILPYLYPEERLAIYAEQLSSGLNLPDGYLGFIENPVNFLTQFNNVGQIIFISGNDESGLTVTANPDRPRGPVYEPGQTNEDIPLSGDDNEIKNKRLPSERFPEFSSLSKDFKQVFICEDDTRYFIKGVWHFYFYNIRNNNKKLVESFRTKVTKAFPEFSNTGNDIVQLQSFFKKKAKLISLYKEVFKEENLNPTSLVVLHGPYTRNKVSGLFRTPWWRHYDNELKKVPRHHSLLTGDLYLKAVSWPPYITDNYEKIGLIQIPHHGSSKKWDPAILDSPDLVYPVYAVINFGLGNTYHHPTSQVVEDVRRLRWDIKLAHELKAFKYYFFIQ